MGLYQGSGCNDSIFLNNGREVLPSRDIYRSVSAIGMDVSRVLGHCMHAFCPVFLPKRLLAKAGLLRML
jgi:hypothetical protein